MLMTNDEKNFNKEINLQNYKHDSFDLNGID